MLGQLEVHGTLPASDMARAKKFYADKLGLTPLVELPGGDMVYKCKNSFFLIYPSQYAGTAQNTAMEWSSHHIEQDVEELRSKGVIFEEYDLPGLKTVNGIATLGKDKAAWFKDSEGNILGFGQIAQAIEGM